MKTINRFSRVVIIYNPNSTGDAPAIAKSLAKSLDKAFPKLKIELSATQHAGHARELAYTATKQYSQPLIVAVSGDGGYHEAVNGTLQAMHDKVARQPVVTVVGAGNANDHYRSTNRKPLKKLIAEDSPRPIDLLKITLKGSKGKSTYYAHSYAGFGVSPRVAQELNKYKLNLFKELYILGKTMLDLRPVAIQYDNKIRRVDSLVFANIHEMAKILTLHTKTNLHDGKFEAVEIPHGSLLRLIFTLLKAAIWSLGEQEQHTRYEFMLCEDTPLQIDGEVVECRKGDVICVTVAKDAILALY